MPRQEISALKSAQQGVVLLEAMIAILIFSFAILGIVGLQAAMVKNTSEAKYRADASLIAQQTIGKMWTDPASFLAGSAVVASHFSQPDISDLLPNGTLTVAPQSATQYRVTVTWQEPGKPQQHNFTTIATIN